MIAHIVVSRNHGPPIALSCIRTGDVGPAVLCLQLVDHVIKAGLVEARPLELVTDDSLDLVRGEGDCAFLQRVLVQVGRELRVRHGRVRGRDHLGPDAHVRLVDLLEHILHFELSCTAPVRALKDGEVINPRTDLG